MIFDLGPYYTRKFTVGTGMGLGYSFDVKDGNLELAVVATPYLVSLSKDESAYNFKVAFEISYGFDL